ncbi:uncharacterized protein LOC143364684 [Halictus rubicundus]|uniref:uncharacterized protein LOC143364684 n=1 Tax=Halictus rubicundus TaxID=77578 RepID=UPI0040373FBB
MNYQHYYDRRNDSYVIHFWNFKGISEDEIKKMFSVYGSATIKGSGGQFGFYFIRYKNLEDTLNCLNGFKGHKSIKILPHKNKINNKPKNKKHTNNKWKPGKTTKTLESAFEEDEIPSLVHRNKKTIIPAQEVIIANIDTSVELKEILTLFNDYRPIAKLSSSEYHTLELGTFMLISRQSVMH